LPVGIEPERASIGEGSRRAIDASLSLFRLAVSWATPREEPVLCRLEGGDK